MVADTEGDVVVTATWVVEADIEEYLGWSLGGAQYGQRTYRVVVPGGSFAKATQRMSSRSAIFGHFYKPNDGNGDDRWKDAQIAFTALIPMSRVWVIRDVGEPVDPAESVDDEESDDA